MKGGGGGGGRVDDILESEKHLLSADYLFCIYRAIHFVIIFI